MRPVALLAAATLAVACTATAFGPRHTALAGDAVALPARFTRGVFLLQALLPSHPHPLTLLLDTGTDRTLLDHRLVQDLGLRAVGDESVVTATGSTVPGVKLERLPWLQLGDARFSDIDVVGLDLSSLREHGGLPIVGIAGCDLFRQCLLEIDCARRTVRVQPLSKRPAAPGHAFSERSPWVTAEIAGRPLRMLVDTGFEQRLALPPGIDLPWHAEPRSDGDLATIDGTAAMSRARLQGELRIGDLAWSDPQVALVPGSPKIGTRLLRDCRLLLDAGGGRIWIERVR